MSEEVTNGRPRWTDVLHQLELTEARIKESVHAEGLSMRSDIAGVKTDVAGAQASITVLSVRVQSLEMAQQLGEQRKKDLFQAGSLTRVFVLTLVAVAGLILGIVNIVK